MRSGGDERLAWHEKVDHSLDISEGGTISIFLRTLTDGDDQGVLKLTAEQADELVRGLQFASGAARWIRAGLAKASR